jgi:hypothetical protein
MTTISILEIIGIVFLLGYSAWMVHRAVSDSSDDLSIFRDKKT